MPQISASRASNQQRPASLFRLWGSARRPLLERENVRPPERERLPYPVCRRQPPLGHELDYAGLGDFEQARGVRRGDQVFGRGLLRHALTIPVSKSLFNYKDFSCINPIQSISL